MKDWTTKKHVSPKDLQDFLTLAELPTPIVRKIENGEHHLGFDSSNQWPKVHEGGNIKPAGGCFAWAIVSSLLIPLYGMVKLVEFGQKQLTPMVRREKWLMKIHRDLLFQSLGPIAGSVFGDTATEFVEKVGGLDQGWQIKSEARQATLSLEVQQRLLADGRRARWSWTRSQDTLETVVDIGIVRQDGLAVLVPERWAHVLEVEEDGSLRARFEQPLASRVAGIRQNEGAEDPLEDLPALLADVLRINRLDAATLPASLGKGVSMRAGALTAEPKQEPSFDVEVEVAGVRSTTRRGAWARQKWWWWKTFKKNLLLMTLGGLCGMFVYGLNGAFMLLSGSVELGVMSLMMAVSIACSMVMIAKPFLPRLSLLRKQRVNRAQTRLKLESNVLSMDSTSLELSSPFAVNLSRSPAGVATRYLNVEVTQRDGVGKVERISFKTPLAGDEALGELPELKMRARTVDPEAFCEEIWPALRSYAGAQGMTLPFGAQLADLAESESVGGQEQRVEEVVEVRAARRG